MGGGSCNVEGLSQLLISLLTGFFNFFFFFSLFLLFLEFHSLFGGFAMDFNVFYASLSVYERILGHRT